MIKMPEKIYASNMVWSTGYHHVNCTDKPMSKRQEQYTHTQQLIEKLEGYMSEFSVPREIDDWQQGCYYGRNKAVADFIKMLRGEVE